MSYIAYVPNKKRISIQGICYTGLIAAPVPTLSYASPVDFHCAAMPFVVISCRRLLLPSPIATSLRLCPSPLYLFLLSATTSLVQLCYPSLPPLALSITTTSVCICCMPPPLVVIIHGHLLSPLFISAIPSALGRCVYQPPLYVWKRPLSVRLCLGPVKTCSVLTSI